MRIPRKPPKRDIPPLKEFIRITRSANGTADLELIEKAIAEIAAMDATQTPRLSGILTGAGFIFATSNVLIVAEMGGAIFSLPAALALGAAYAALTALQYTAHKTPGHPADDVELEDTRKCLRYRMCLASLATVLLGFSIVALPVLAFIS